MLPKYHAFLITLDFISLDKNKNVFLPVTLALLQP